jgi:hypothetical protein
MERSDERLSTRDIASGGQDPEPERDTAVADPVESPPADTAAVPDERTDRDVDEQPADEGAVAARAARDETDAGTDAGSTGTAADDDTPLLEGADEFQARWEQIQVRFVDEPRGAVEDADALVATVMQRLADGFASEREHLEAQWGRGEDISTEDLRVALQRYRSFFRRLLAT